jgi:purine-binding chemotaxis protein CheW
MKKKNKVENSLERLFSTKKSDLANSNQENNQIEQAVEEVIPTGSANTDQDKPEPIVKKQKSAAPSKSSGKKDKAPSNKKDKGDKKSKVPEIAAKLPPMHAEAVSPGNPTEPEIPKDQARIAETNALPIETAPVETSVDEPMTNAIVAKKNESDYDSDEHLVIFTLAGQSYGISIMIVESIIKMQDITWVPRAHPSIEGATNLRGVVLPVINLCMKLGLPVTDHEDSKRIIVIAIQDITAGFVVDNVQSVFQIAANEISPPSPMVSAVNTKYIKGIAKNGDKGLVIILDPEKIFESIVTETKDKNQITLLR